MNNFAITDAINHIKYNTVNHLSSSDYLIKSITYPIKPIAFRITHLHSYMDIFIAHLKM